jgi:hypothetical protein
MKISKARWILCILKQKVEHVIYFEARLSSKSTIWDSEYSLALTFFYNVTTSYRIEPLASQISRLWRKVIIVQIFLKINPIKKLKINVKIYGSVLHIGPSPPNIMSHSSSLKWQIWALYTVRFILHSYEPKYIETRWAAHFGFWDDTYVQEDSLI